MIYISKGKEPASLTEYRKEKFAYYDGYKDKGDIRNALLKEQGYLCAYCMRRISREKMKIEHWYPEEELSNSERLDYSNMLGCCEGHLAGGKFREDTCDTHKKSTIIKINPTKQKHIDQISYKHSGEIYSSNSEFQQDLDVTLNLNCDRHLLTENRKAVLDEVKRMLATMQKNGLWNRKLLEKVYLSYSSADADGMKKEYAGIVLWYIGKKLNKNI